MHILVADDDKHLREGLAALLNNAGYECSIAEDGIDALTIYQSTQPDLCILDVMMPRMDGLHLCRLLRKRAPSLPILLLTALDKDSDQVTGLDLGADDYINKPFNPQTLLARVRALLRRCITQKKEAPEQVKCEKLLIDSDQMLAFYEGKKILLTQREQKFLCLLLQQPHQTFSRNEIFDHCWNKEFLPNSRSLDQFVLTLRQKLEKELGTPRFIKTVYGLGYSCNSSMLR